VNYRLLDTTRAYALEKLISIGEHGAVARRHADYYRDALARGTDLHSEGKHSESEKLGNLRAALEWCFGPSGHGPLGVGLAAHAAPLLLTTSRLECLRWAECAVGALDEASVGSREEMNLQASLGQALMFSNGNTDRACDAFRRGLAIAEAQHDDVQQLRLLGGLHLHNLSIGDFPAALEYAERAKALADRLGEEAAISAATSLLGVAYHVIGDHKAAHGYLTTALASDRRLKPTSAMLFGFDHSSRARVALTRSLWLQGYPDQAVEIAREAVAIAGTLRDPVGACMAR
jgi:tetratricopeptide (TPR) repeat protein